MTKSSQHVTGPLVKLIIFITITVVTTGILGISIANLNLSATNTYKARFSDATLLLKNDDVRIAGVRVGQVEEIRVVDKRNAEVVFAVDAAKRLPTSTTRRSSSATSSGSATSPWNRVTAIRPNCCRTTAPAPSRSIRPNRHLT